MFHQNHFLEYEEIGFKFSYLERNIYGSNNITCYYSYFNNYKSYIII
jgi:hypothetical protein